MSFRAGISPPPTTGIPSSSTRRDSIASTSRYRTAIFDFAITISSVEEYPRVVNEPISRHAAFSPSSNPFRKAFRLSSSPIPVGGIRPRRAYRDFAARSANVAEVLALVRRLRRGLDVFQLRGDRVDLLRLRLEFVEGDLDPEVLREHVEHGLRGLRVDEVAGRLAHEADGVHIVQAAQAEEQATRADNPRAGLAAREHHAVLLHLLHEIDARRGAEDARLRDDPAHPVPAEREHAADAELLQLPQDEIAELVLPLGREALVVPRDEDEVLPRASLHVVHLVVDELDLPIFLHEDLGREVLREDLRELDRLQLVLQVFRGELADVPDAGQAFDARRIVELRVVEVPDHDVVHGVSSLQFVGPLKFAPVHAVPVFRRIAGRHRVPRRMAARRAARLKRVPAARLGVAVDHDVRRDDVLPRDLDERLDPGVLEALVLEGVFVHHARLECAVQRAERIEELVAELVPALRRRLPEARRDDPEQVLRLLLVLPLLDLLAALMFVDRFQREVDVALVLVDLQDFADDLLALAHVVADVLDPAAADLGDMDEAFLALVFVERDEGPEVLDVGHGTDDELALVGPVVPAPGGLRLRHYSRTPRISPRIAAFPPVGFATVAPQTWHKTVLAARSKTTCSLPQSSHLTRRNRLVGFGITCGPPRVRTSSRGSQAAGGPSCTPCTGTGDGSASSASRGLPASGGGSRRSRP